MHELNVSHWAFQDSSRIQPNTTRYHCKICFLFWDIAKESEEALLEKAKYLPSACKPNDHIFKVISPADWIGPTPVILVKKRAPPILVKI